MEPSDVLSVARKLAELLLDLIGESDAKKLLDQAAIDRANLAADIAERAKFGA